MEDSILQSIAYVSEGGFPEKEIKQIIENKNKYITELLNVIEYVNKNSEKVAEDEDYVLHLYSLYLLAQFKVKEAYPLVIELICKDSEVVDALLGDVITEGVARFLACTYTNDLEPIKAIVEKEELHEYVRGAALKTLAILALHGEYSMDEFKAYIQSLFHGKLEKTPSAVWDELASICCDFSFKEMKQFVLKAYAEDLIEPFVVNLESIDIAFSRSEEEAISELKHDIYYDYIKDTIYELKNWHCFNTQKSEYVNQNYNYNNMLTNGALIKSEKLGRNEPCPCGSGKKYKKCCGK